ncbi:MAG TPA: hypothetical protein VFB79_05410 [Candidatus Angelobacter sp.]|nr:hypothetical protein [Candidatus Angelobacter sp.]
MGVQLTPVKNFRIETRPSPAVYRPAPPVFRTAQQKPQPGMQTPTGKVETNKGIFTRHHLPGVVNRSVQPKLTSRSVGNSGSKNGVVQRMQMDEDDLIDRLIRSNNRNESEKSQPVVERSIFDLQQSSSYGFENNVIDDGMLKGSFRRGWGSQPFLSLNKNDFGGAVVKSDYDAIIAVFQKDPHNEWTIAEDILAKIDHGTEPKGYSNETLRAMSTLIQLTQVIESHGSRVPGVDKYARASLSMILNGKSTFHAEFNRKDGNYLPARAKVGGSKFGGQEATLALVGKPKKSHKAKRKDVVNPGVLATLAEMSDSSGDENSDDEEMSD